MSAQQYGARLLEEIQEESLEQFLAELRCAIDPQPRSILGVPQLDSLLESLRYPTTQDSPHRRAWPSSPGTTSPAVEEEDQDDDEVSPRGPPPRAPPDKPKPATIELTSVKSASGKTSLLSHLCAVSVLPRDRGGKESTVVYIDADGRFSPTRLAQMMNHCLQTHHQSSEAPQPPLTDLDALQETIRSSLDHVHVFRPQSSAQMTAVLASLHTYLLNRSRHHSILRPLSLIVIDSATAFYWQDRSDQALAKLESLGTAPGGGPSRAAELIEKLKALQERFGCAVLASTTSPSTSSSPPFPSPSTRTLNDETTTTATTTTTSASTAPAPSDRDIRLVSPWTSYATLSLTLARLPVAQFPAQMDMEACLRDRDKRLEAVRKGRFVATLVPSGAAALVGADGERGKGKGKGVLRFRITKDGVEFE
ncbi:hypothetical protein AYL99_01512 [Fonsecaea erecta]|uniref:Rad51-like C-terminal domain-containing protein n=1 Tax=Fonsecaea erecta TaxID=1367422 RepID=A0A179A067_9EURO|nr:hypothetical protein AYL99_01512 [Fonsecaea erecta]OAP65540.1 hypothetical protein AYL99_01512 [Fonsecaea erecta]